MTLLAVAGTVLSGCSSTLENVKLTMAAGGKTGVYYALGNALADIWSGRLGIARPQVVATAGSVDNVKRLVNGQADVGFSQADATDMVGAAKLRALARMHDDYLQIIVRADVQAKTLRELGGLRVSIGEPSSGVELIANRVLESVKVTPNILHLNLEASARAMQEGRLDAFFWSGGLPTPQISMLTKSLGVRMLDLSADLPALLEQYPVYGSATLPASTYELTGGPVTTLVVRNFLLATESMSDEVAEALVRQLFTAQPELVRANSAARTIERRSAIETSPIPLHPGAMRYYRDIKV
ncbi:C4-dicarboxylate ABC transporter substrate-binding protein [Lentzea sp. NBRC 105346]|uniref:TAXI family TRAP transporter solute-binding subunit n=1 Tax=Lentzea sp. NBRC 105346 TaxID=3032205 RepID=UPI0024A5A639|nr:TAXI family TRAP transporter solute-binding subunit [Lentzea sp. NBRC 105346]GLZ34218.1 C4-dicarboxylate ABC transporter substrate-binding protein [Lentzea sp. NBRC 105346]